MALRLKDAMCAPHDGRLAAELACLRPQHNISAMARGPDFRIVGVSAGFRRAWPQTCDLLGENTRQHLINEAAHYCEDEDYLREAADGELLMVTCVSDRILGIGDEAQGAFRLRWHAIVRHIDDELVHEMVYEPCDAQTPIRSAPSRAVSAVSPSAERPEKPTSTPARQASVWSVVRT